MYLSGAITNNPNYKAEFARAQKAEEENGYTVVNPTRTPLDPEQFEYDEFMKVDFLLLSMCDAIVLLPGWKKSKGARKELEFAIRNNLEIINRKKEKQIETFTE